MAYLRYSSSLREHFSCLEEEEKKRILKTVGYIAGVVIVGKTCCHIYEYVSHLGIRRRKLAESEDGKRELKTKLSATSSNKEKFTRLSYAEIKEQLDDGKLTAVELLHAYQAKALDVDSRLNCVTEPIREAEMYAFRMDALPKENRGRLHGIPLSVDDIVPLSGYDITVGCTTMCGNPVPDNAAVLQAFMNEGMVPFVRTNEPQSGMAADCKNPIYGVTVNPHNTQRNPGGSSGGEGALIAGGGSMIGVGADVAGSLRIPSHSTGIFSLKPTTQRLSCRGFETLPTVLDPPMVDNTLGVLSSDLNLLTDAMRVLYSDAAFSMDSRLPRLYFDEKVLEEKRCLRIGYYEVLEGDQHCMVPVPAVRRAVREAKAVLESRGHEVVAWQPPNVKEFGKMALKSYYCDGGHGFKLFGDNEPILDRHLYIRLWQNRLGRVSRTILAMLVWPFSPIYARYLMLTRGFRSCFDLNMYIAAVKAYRRDFAKAWEQSGLDAVICPVQPFPAMPKDMGFIMPDAMYTMLYNFVDFPAGVVPVTKVTEKDIQELKTSYSTRDCLNRRVANAQTGSVGLPIGVQCVAKMWNDEMSLRVMREISEGL